VMPHGGAVPGCWRNARPAESSWRHARGGRNAGAVAGAAVNCVAIAKSRRPAVCAFD
jgi:hypothetical protein